MTAANGAGAPKGDPLAVILQYRGLAFQCGGDNTLDEHVTVASKTNPVLYPFLFIISSDVLKKFSPNLMGYSTGIGSANVWEVSKLNQAVPGAEASDIITQARALVQIIQSHKEVNWVIVVWTTVNLNF